MLTSIIVHNVDEIERELESTRRTGGRSGVAMASPSEQSTNPAQQMAKFWNIYCHEKTDSNFINFINVFIRVYEELITQRVTTVNREGPHLTQLPGDFLTVLGHHLKNYRKAIETEVEQVSLNKIENIIKSLCIICRNFDNIPFVASCEFVSDAVIVLSSVLQYVKLFSTCPLLSSCLSVLDWGLWFFEHLYDPYSNWRSTLNGLPVDFQRQQYSPAFLHIEIIPFFYDCCHSEPHCYLTGFTVHCLHMFGAVLSGGKHNALKASCPATLEVLLRCVTGVHFEDEVRTVALECLTQFLHILLKSKADQIQVDVVMVLSEFCKRWQMVCSTDMFDDQFLVASKILVTVQKLISSSPKALQHVLEVSGWIDGLLDVFGIIAARITSEKSLAFAAAIIKTVFFIFRDNKETRNRMLQIGGYKRLLESLKRITSPSFEVLDSLICLVCDGEYNSSSPSSPKLIHPEVVSVLVLWIPYIEIQDFQHWLANTILTVCSRRKMFKMLCTKVGLMSNILSALRLLDVNSKAAISLIKLFEVLGCYSMRPRILKETLLLLRTSTNGDQFPFTSQMMRSLITIAKKDSFEEALCFFDFQDTFDGITIPAIAKWPGYGFGFQAWVCLNDVTHQESAVPLYRRQLYSMCTTSGCGLEAFFLPDGILVIAVLTKKEYLTVSVADHPINDSKWHAIVVCHSASRRPFMQSQLVVYIDGKLRLTSQIKCPSFSEAFTHCRIGNGSQRFAGSDKFDNAPPSTTERLLSNLPIPSFFSLPLPLKSSSSHEYGVNVLASGMQDKVWGMPSSLQGQLGSVCLFHDILQPSHVRSLHSAGPNHLMLFTGDDSELVDLANKLVLFYHAKACEGTMCMDLSPGRQYDGCLTGVCCSTWDIKEAVNCIGGVQAMFPLLENVRDTNAIFVFDGPSPDNSSISEDSMDDWVVLPSSSYSEWKLQQNQAAGFLVLIKNFVLSSPSNLDYLLSTNGVATIGALLQKIPPALVDVHLLMAVQLLLESCGNRECDISLRHAVYQHMLFDFSIWSKSDFTVRIGHIQYLSAIIKDDRKYFRKKYGVQFLLDVIRQFYSCQIRSLEPEDCKAIRVSLLGLVRYFITKDVNNKEMSAILGFLFSVKDEEMLTEVLEMLVSIMEPRHCKDQIYLLLYEPGGIELVYCLLLNPIYSIQFRSLVLRLVAVVLKTSKVYEKSKVRLRLQDIGLAGLVNRLEGIPVSSEMIKLLVDQVLMTDNVMSYQGLLVLLYFIRFTDVNLKLQVSRQVVQTLLLNSNAPHLIALQHAWHDCILQLLIKKQITGSQREKISDELEDKIPPGAASITSVSPNKEAFVGISGSPLGVDASQKNTENAIPSSLRSKTPQCFHTQVFDFDTQSLGNRSLCSSKESSVEDLTVSQSSDGAKGQELLEASGNDGGNDSSDVDPVEQPLDLDIGSLNEESLKSLVTLMPENFNDAEDELCQLVCSIVFTVMWRGISGADRRTWKERGQVFACINILALGNQLYKSHLELKRRILELILQAAVNDLKEAGQANASYTENAVEVMKWTYDLVVVDHSQDHSKKLSKKLLDAVLSLMDTLMVFEETPNDEEWAEMVQMCFKILLECASSENLEICAMATPKLHALIQTRMTGSKVDEVFFLLYHLDTILAKTVKNKNQDHYSFIIPLMKALLETAAPRLLLIRHLPLLPSNQTGPSFFEDFQQYCQGNEWRQFIEKQVRPIARRYTQLTINQFPEVMNEFWNECCEETIVSLHRRNREWGESRLKFQSCVMELFSNKCIEEQMRYNNMLAQTKQQNLLIRRRWRLKKLFLQGPRGPWALWSEKKFHWKLSHHENLSRMRLKLVLNHHFDPHLEASRLRDNLGIPQLQPESLPLAVAREAKGNMEQDDILNEEDLKAFTASEIQELELTRKEKLLLTEECELVALMSVVKGRLELTTTHIYFFDSTQVREDVERYDFKFPLLLLREVHLRRYNLRRSALEFFLLDQTNYFLNFNTKSRNKVYSKILGLRPTNLFVYSSGSPADVLRASGFTQKWVQREMSNFDYLMMLNTIAGRTYNDLSQYPVFPWILKDYESEELDLINPNTFRDLSKPVGVVNPNNIPEVKAKYDHFEDPTGLIEKFHYGTHYSNSAGVLHYLVRLEPFASLHIELQSGRFDVADRQFHSIPGTWKMLMENPNDVKELIPEFFYLPEFLVNMNAFDLGRLQGSKEIIGDVVLPKWAKSPEDFIFKHYAALESEYVSCHLHEWIDLIFGYKQKGPAAVEALNVFYYCSYEGAVNLDTIADPVARAAMEGMINNFGQTPCQLLKEPHPARMSLQETTEKLVKLDAKGTSLLLFLNNLRLFEVELSIQSDPAIFLFAPHAGNRMGVAPTGSDCLLTITECGAIGIHNWLPYNKTISSFFTLDLDPTFTNMRTQRKLPLATQPGVSLSFKLFVVSHDGRLLYSGGHWDNSIRVYKFAKIKSFGHLVGHKDTVSCLAIDHLSRHLISGSRDHTCIVWDISGYQAVSGKEMPGRRLHVLYGHDDEVTCVAIMTELDLAVSGSKDGTINLHTVREGLYLQTLHPGIDHLKVDVTFLALSDQGQIIACSIATDNSGKQVRHSLHVFSINGKLLWEDAVSGTITSILTSGRYIIMGNSKGQLSIHDLYELRLQKVLPLPSAICHLAITNRNTHILASLHNGRLMVVGLALPVDLK